MQYLMWLGKAALFFIVLDKVEDLAHEHKFGPLDREDYKRA